MRVPLVGGAYQSRSLNMNAQRCVNLFPEVDKTSRHVIGLYGTPGKVLRLTLPTSPVRALFTGETYLYAIGGNTAYYIDTNWSATSMGTLNTSTGVVSIDQNLTQLVLVDGTNGYTSTLPTGAVTQIADADFTQTPSRVTVFDGYAIVDNVGTEKFYISAINDATSWDALDFASESGKPDDILSLIADHRELILLGAQTSGIWENSGNSDFPISRKTFLEQGCAAKHAVCKADGGVFFIGSSDRGDSIVYRLVGYNLERISTHAIENAISGYSTISDATAWAHEEEGHTFIVFTFPTGNATWVYDIAASAAAGQPMWHERAYMNQATSALGRDLASCHAFFNRFHVVGDYNSGKIYTLDLDTYTDNAEYIKRLRSFGTSVDNRVYEVSMTDPVKCVLLGGDLKTTKGVDRNFHHRLQVLMETGVGLVSGQGSDPQVTLRYSNDNGHTWSNELWGSAGLYTGGGGNLGEYQKRVIFRRLGTVKAEFE